MYEAYLKSDICAEEIRLKDEYKAKTQKDVSVRDEFREAVKDQK